jgi:hypothetical protein
MPTPTGGTLGAAAPGVAGSTSITFRMTDAPLTVRANFVQTFAVTVNNTGTGGGSFAGNTASTVFAAGEVVTLRPGTRAGEKLASWNVTVGGISVAPNNTFTMPAGPVTVAAVWEVATNPIISIRRPTSSTLDYEDLQPGTPFSLELWIDASAEPIASISSLGITIDTRLIQWAGTGAASGNSYAVGPASTDENLTFLPPAIGHPGEFSNTPVSGNYTTARLNFHSETNTGYASEGRLLTLNFVVRAAPLAFGETPIRLSMVDGVLEPGLFTPTDGAGVARLVEADFEYPDTPGRTPPGAYVRVVRFTVTLDTEGDGSLATTIAGAAGSSNVKDGDGFIIRESDTGISVTINAGEVPAKNFATWVIVEGPQTLITGAALENPVASFLMPGENVVIRASFVDAGVVVLNVAANVSGARLNVGANAEGVGGTTSTAVVEGAITLSAATGERVEMFSGTLLRSAINRAYGLQGLSIVTVPAGGSPTLGAQTITIPATELSAGYVFTMPAGVSSVVVTINWRPIDYGNVDGNFARISSNDVTQLRRYVAVSGSKREFLTANPAFKLPEANVNGVTAPDPGTVVAGIANQDLGNGVTLRITEANDGIGANDVTMLREFIASGGVTPRGP